MNSGESEDGVSSVAVAVRDQRGVALAAISCAAPTMRMPQRRIGTVAAVLHTRAIRLGELLVRP